jgi:hypothetical protein
MVKRLFFRFGPFGAGAPLALQPSAMTVFVGPNNSGKSLVLRELQQYAEQGRTTGRHIVEGMEVILFSEAETMSLVAGRKSRVPANETLPEGHIRVARPIPSSGSASRLDLNLDHLIQQFSSLRQQQAQGNQDWWKTCWNGIYAQFTSLFTVALDGKTRLALTEPRASGDLLASPANHLASLF